MSVMSCDSDNPLSDSQVLQKEHHFGYYNEYNELKKKIRVLSNTKAFCTGNSTVTKTKVLV